MDKRTRLYLCVTVTKTLYSKCYTYTYITFCVTVRGNLMKQSKMMKQVLTILNNQPDKALTLFCIAEDMQKAEGFNRKSSLRASLSRCLNRLKKEGIVTSQYKTGKGKFWSITKNKIPGSTKKTIVKTKTKKDLQDNFLTVEPQKPKTDPTLKEQTFENKQTELLSSEDLEIQTIKRLQKEEKKETPIRTPAQQRKDLLYKINIKAKQEGFLTQYTKNGVLLAPIINGSPITQEELSNLPQETKNRILLQREKLTTEIKNMIKIFVDIAKKIKEENKQPVKNKPETIETKDSVLVEDPLEWGKKYRETAIQKSLVL